MTQQIVSYKQELRELEYKITALLKDCVGQFALQLFILSGLF